jgi:hypothetical protein
MRAWDSKTDNTDPAHTGFLTAAEDDARGNELANLCTQAGITLDAYNLAAGADTDLTMVGQAVARYASGGLHYSDSGTATAYVLASPLSFVMPKALFSGMVARFMPANTNTGAATANVNGTGAISILRWDGTALQPGDISVNSQVTMRYSQSSAAWKLDPWITMLSTASPSNRNIVGRNGGLEVWQRGTSIAVAAGTASVYTCDGWYLSTGSNQASVVNRVAGLVPQSLYAAKVWRNNGQNGTGTMYFGFPLDTDELLKMAGLPVQMQMVLQAGANWSPTSGNLTYTLCVGTGSVGKRIGSAYTGETQPITGTIAITTTATKYVSTLSATLPTNITCAELQFSWVPTGSASTNDWFAVDDVQLEVGATNVASVTAFERTDHSTDLYKCYRHYWQTYDEGVAPGTLTDASSILSVNNAGSAQTLYMTATLPVHMRSTSPATTFYNAATGASGTWRDGGGVDRTMAANFGGGHTVTFNAAAVPSLTAIHGHMTINSGI